ncbi:MAG: hypothetical protein GY710_00075 [Desulfobacteraceae bacterium]|nr:hypothetical protein [Desulfobacteraceae bacterium]
MDIDTPVILKKFYMKEPINSSDSFIFCCGQVDRTSYAAHGRYKEIEQENYHTTL